MPDLSDTDESAVEDLLARAQDLSILEQISAINCSSFSHSDLPPDLDSRFRRLKSFPLPSTARFAKTPPPDDTLSPSSKHATKFNSDDGVKNLLNSGWEKGFSPSNKSVEKKTRSGSESPNSWLEPESESESESESQSPPRKSGCFWCSPKKAPLKKGKERKGWSGSGLDEEFVADLGILSEKEQRKLMKRAMKEEEKINREVEKIVKLAKQASDRMRSFHGLESEDETWK